MFKSTSNSSCSGVTIGSKGGCSGLDAVGKEKESKTLSHSSIASRLVVGVQVSVRTAKPLSVLIKTEEA